MFDFLTEDGARGWYPGGDSYVADKNAGALRCEKKIWAAELFTRYWHVAWVFLCNNKVVFRCRNDFGQDAFVAMMK